MRSTTRPARGARARRSAPVAAAALLAWTGACAAQSIGVVGRAVDQLGRPIAGATLRLASAGDLAGGAPLGAVAADGAFAVDVPRVGLDDLDLGRVPVLFVAARGRASVALTIWDRGRARVDLGAITLFGGVTVRGVVRDDAGAPLAGARITAAATRPTNPFHAGWVGWEGLAMPHQDPARELAVAVSDADGRFTLAGVPPLGASLQATADGWSTWRSGPLVAGAPLDVTLTRRGFARGVAVGTDGAPTAAQVLLLDESGAGRVTTTGPGGAFAIPLPTASRYALLAVPRRGDPLDPGAALDAAAWQAGPADGLRIRVHAAAARERPTLAVRVVAADGRPLPDASAAVVWGIDAERAEGSARHALAALVRLEPAGEDGAVPVRRPRRGEPFAGVVLATAPGHGIGAVPVQWQPFQRPGVLTATLPGCGALRGRVLLAAEVAAADAAARAGAGRPDRGREGGGGAAAPVVPLAGAVVEALPAGARPLPADLESIGRRAVTDADGWFTIDGLTPGRFAVSVCAPGRPRADSAPITVRAGATATLPPVAVPRGVTFAGRLTGARFDFHTQVVLTPLDAELPPGPFSQAIDRLPHNALRVADVAADGSFRISGLDLGPRTLRIALPRFHPGPPPAPLPIADLRVAGDGVDVEVPAAAAVPARIEGRVAIDAARVPVPPGRLVLVAAPHDPALALPGAQLAELGTDLGPHVVLGPDGAFALRLPAGVWVLRVVDAVTGVVVATTETLAVAPAERRELRLPLRVARVRVRLAAAAADDPFVGQWLSIESEEPGPFVDEAVEAALRRTTTRLERAVDVGPDRVEHELFVAPGRVRLGVFGVRAGRGFSFAAVFDPDLEPLVERELRVAAGDDVQVGLTVSRRTIR